ncbi:M6 family metalloprotease domain-containing protein [Bailinhaonella thermotolerans]|uniref:M6 family metalloprotease domain-containing protein n=1 Tax=Bailinhaonella thermotolerans TaxID=1070861 RepID=A0A3A4AX14_9ACTN|nr:M6 family metalloprotease domain-containing protein [Bailinhaonella thermotolerans]RJL34505.1 M6 family metalloprotease domain-containing protein [Bailinhaonella thermotolerans]
MSQVRSGLRRRLMVALMVALVPAGLAAAPASAEPEPPPPWRADHWPKTQPWQTDGPGREQVAARAEARAGVLSRPEAPPPIDPQNWKNPDHMTWADYKKVPGTNWADPARNGSVRDFKGALVLVDYPNQSFVVTQPAGSTVFGNPSVEAHDIPREQVAQFYQDFLNKPQPLNRGHTIHEWWMEDSGGRYGVDLTGFGPYKMPGKSHEYAMEFQSGTGCPAGDTCTRNFRADARAAWVAAVGEETARQFDFIFFLSAGQDESSTWQEFGPIKFEKKEDVTDPWGPPDPALPNWVRTRYVEWTSWASGSSIWPNATRESSIQAESSGQSVYAHELSHILGIGDNYNNPFGVPPRRDYTGMWEMLSRGTFNGPGGPHSRWLIPPTAGSSMGAHHMLRNKLQLKMVDEQNVLRLSREALAESGLVVADVTARAVRPGENGLSGVNVAMTTGDKSPACVPATDPYCDGGKYDNYTVEVVDRMGADSFTADSGVLLAKTKNVEAPPEPFEWVIDANPQDIGMTDFVRPDGTEVKITLGDYRQLSDALFHAGANSGSEYEYVDQANRLHFYVLDLKRDKQGVLSYTVAIRSLDGAGPQARGVRLLPAAGVSTPKRWATCRFPLLNTGRAAAPGGSHPEDVSAYVGKDVYRLSASIEGRGWEVWLPNELATAAFGKHVTVPVHAHRGDGGSRTAKLRLTATSESDKTKTSTATCQMLGL